MPIIVAEHLVELEDPLAAVLRAGPERPVGEVLGSMAAGLAPARDGAGPPAWLRPDQVAPFQRALAALERHGGALVADPVGSGKTWIALAVAARLGGAIALVPAALRAQWQRAAAAAGVPLLLHSHEALSRGRAPAREGRLVIIDESHRFRTPDTRRYHTVAPWLVGSRVLLLSATPVVNRLTDLAHQLLLGVRDDALAARGVPSLRRMLEQGESAPALGDLVLVRPRVPDRPAVAPRVLAWSPGDEDDDLLAAIDQLRLSRDRATRGLIRMVLWRALASSRAALGGALSRYERLLAQAAHAGASGRTVSRQEIRRFTGGELDQLLLWELLPAESAAADLVLEDRAALAALRARLATLPPDPRAGALAALLGDGRVTLVFTGSRDTHALLRHALEGLRPAWVTGSAAGIGPARLARESVLALFRPEAAWPEGARLPAVLLATDVAAEGLDLQRAERIVHFDLPWTSVRLDQREGRAVRMGSLRREVEVVRLSPWPALETRLAAEERLVNKRRLVGRAGIDAEGQWLYRWRTERSDAVAGNQAEPGLALVRGDEPGWLVGLALDLLGEDGSLRREPAGLFWIAADGGITEDAELVAARLDAFAGKAEVSVTPGAKAAAERALFGLARQRLALLTRHSWLAREAGAAQRRMVRRMRRVVVEAARERNRALLALGDQALAWLAGGVTAGEAALLETMLTVPRPRLAAAWRPLLARPRERRIPVLRLTGMVGVCNFPACHPSGPCCSTSTAR